MTTFTTTARGAARFTDSDLVNVTSRALAVPLQEIYGLLWRAGVLEITD